VVYCLNTASYKAIIPTRELCDCQHSIHEKDQCENFAQFSVKTLKGLIKLCDICIHFRHMAPFIKITDLV
jgi:hypothetical protein